MYVSSVIQLGGGTGTGMDNEVVSRRTSKASDKQTPVTCFSNGDNSYMDTPLFFCSILVKWSEMEFVYCEAGKAVNSLLAEFKISCFLHSLGDRR